MRTFYSLIDQWRPFVAVAGGIIAVSVLIAACSDDPILGPSDGESEGGGSYSVIEKLAQPDTTARTDSADTSAAPMNPERF